MKERKKPDGEKKEGAAADKDGNTGILPARAQRPRSKKKAQHGKKKKKE